MCVFPFKLSVSKQTFFNSTRILIIINSSIAPAPKGTKNIEKPLEYMHYLSMRKNKMMLSKIMYFLFLHKLTRHMTKLEGKYVLQYPK